MLPSRRTRSFSLALAASVALLGTLAAGPALADDVSPGPGSETTTAPTPAPEPEPAPAPEPEPVPDPAPEPAPETGPDPAPDPATEPAEEQDAAADPETAPEPETEPEDTADGGTRGPVTPQAAGPVVVSGTSAIVVEATSAAGADVPVQFSISGGWSDSPTIINACAVDTEPIVEVLDYFNADFFQVGFGTSFSASPQLAVGSYHGSCLWAPLSLFNLLQFKLHAFTIEVKDPLPTVTVPADLQAEATGAAGAAVDFAVSGNDVIDGALPVTCTTSGDLPVASGDVFPIGTTTVTCSVTNSRDVDATDSFDVVVGAPLPTVTVPTDQVIEATGPTGAVAAFEVTGADFVGTALVPTCTANGSPVASGATFALGTTEVTCKVTDGWAGEASDVFDVSVVDTTGPVLTLPEDITVEATGPNGAAVEFVATATDAVAGPVPVTCTPESGSTFALGTTEVTCSATDEAAALRSARATPVSGSFAVTVVEAPVVPEEPGGEVGGETGGSGAVGGAEADADALPNTGAPSLTLPLLLAGGLLLAGAGLVVRRRA